MPSEKALAMLQGDRCISFVISVILYMRRSLEMSVHEMNAVAQVVA